MSPNIKTSHIFAKNIFQAKKINTKFKYLNLEIIRDKKFNNPDPFGIYYMFFRKYLIYIGSWCGNWSKDRKKLEGSSANERWYKHIITDTSRFQNITFRRADDKFNINEIRNLIKNKDEKIKTNDKGKVTLAAAIELFRENKVNISLYKKLINSRFSVINSKIVSEYCGHNSESSIFEDIIVPLKNIKYNDIKEYQKILTGGSIAHSPNRFKISDKFWDEFKTRDEENIFEDFEFVYFQFYEFEKLIPELETLILEEPNRKIVKKLFREFFELPFIKKYQPPANDDKDKKKGTVNIPKSTLVKYKIEDIINEVNQELLEMCKPVKFLERFSEEKLNKKK